MGLCSYWVEVVGVYGCVVGVEIDVGLDGCWFVLCGICYWFEVGQQLEQCCVLVVEGELFDCVVFELNVGLMFEQLIVLL